VDGSVSCLDCLCGDIAGVGEITASEMRATLHEFNAPEPATTMYHEPTSPNPFLNVLDKGYCLI